LHCPRVLNETIDTSAIVSKAFIVWDFIVTKYSKVFIKSTGLIVEFRWTILDLGVSVGSNGALRSYARHKQIGQAGQN